MGIGPVVGCGLIGAVFGFLILPYFQWFSPPGGTVVMPMPYRIPAAKGMADLRMAMVHDVVTERYVRHGAERDRALRAEADLAQLQESARNG